MSMNQQDIEHLGRDFKQLQAAYCQLEARVAAMEATKDVPSIMTVRASDALSQHGFSAVTTTTTTTEPVAKRGPGRPRKTEG